MDNGALAEAEADEDEIEASRKPEP